MKTLKKLSIGNVKLKNPLLLAPMVDVSDLAFREVCRKSGASIAYTEMLQVEAIDRALNEKAMKLKTLTNSKDNPLGIQITGRRISDFKKVVPYLRNFDLVDINCGCPGHLTIDHGSGSYLLKTPEKIGSIIRLLKDEGLTVSAKIRLGFNDNNVMKIAREINKAEADALTLHTRLATQSRGGHADWSWFSKVKKEIGIPLIGNGDIRTPQDAEKVLEVTDGVMIARAAIGNPMIFKETLEYLKTGKIKETDYKKRLQVYLDYLDLAKKYSLLKMSKAKYIGGKFLRSFEGAPEARGKFMRLKSFEELRGFVRKLI